MALSKRKPSLSCLLLAVASALLCAAAGARPLQVYILAGQSNMEGQAAVRTFDYIGRDPATAPLLAKMRGANGEPRVCENVWISYLTGDGTVKQGRLTAGYGALGGETKIGPEFTFGIALQERVDAPILLIKTAWGGKSLHTDFRPPGAGRYEPNEEERQRLLRRGAGLKTWRAKKDKASGRYYRLMANHVKAVLNKVGDVCPDYDPEQGYEVAGFVWFQGWNDLVDGKVYPKRHEPGGYKLYSTLLAQFIRDVRTEFSAPDMRFVIGVLGVGGETGRHRFREAMAAPAAMPEFKGNVVAVETAPFWDFDMAAALDKQRRYRRIVDTAHSLAKDGSIDRASEWEGFWKALGHPRPADRGWRHVSVDPQRAEDRCPPDTGRRFRDIQLPADLEGWAQPGFDDTQWSRGKAPVGKGLWKRGGITVSGSPSDWGEGEFLLMRTSFEVDSLDYAAYRLSVLARQGFHVYLNGHKVHSYTWWKKQPYYRSIVLGEEQIRHMKKGRNWLAVYANDQRGRNTEEPYGAVDAWIEVISERNKARLEGALEEVLPLEDREILKGASNQGYHYLGSGKIMAQIGQAFAEAMVPSREDGR